MRTPSLIEPEFFASLGLVVFNRTVTLRERTSGSNTAPVYSNITGQVDIPAHIEMLDAVELQGLDYQAYEDVRRVVLNKYVSVATHKGWAINFDSTDWPVVSFRHDGDTGHTQFVVRRGREA